MHISRLNVDNFRNLQAIAIKPSNGLNFVIGQNGSGKTSLLESIYYLSMGRSFRSSNKRIINFDANDFIIFAHLHQDSTNISDELELELDVQKLGLQFTNNGKATYRLNNENIDKQILLTRLLPIIFIGPNTIDLTTAKPDVRRAFLDWGLFYENPEFHSVWINFRNAQKQRNAALEQRLPKKEVLLWDSIYCQHALALHKFREEYFAELLPVFIQIYNSFATGIEIEIKYKAGWDLEQELNELLQTNFQQDYERGYTHYGPHRADISLTVKNVNINYIMSRGQNKIVASALRLAQGKLLEKKVNKKCIYIVDDIAAELDTQKQNTFMQHILENNAQTFISSIHNNFKTEILEQSSVFYIEQGKIITQDSKSVELDLE